MGIFEWPSFGLNPSKTNGVAYQPLSPLSSPIPSKHSSRSKKLGTFRAVSLVATCCIGSFMFAYDTGIVGGVLTLSSFQKDFGYTDAQRTNVNSTAVSILQAGAFFGSFFIWPVTSWLGRRYSLMLCSLTFCLGAILQVINTHSLTCFYVGRVISGFGVGGATVLVPMFSAEMAPKDIRGKLGSCFQLFFALGVTISYWVDYIVTIAISDEKSSQWQIPVGLQFILGAFLGIGMLFHKESARWLAGKGRNQEAFESLKWVRGGEDTHELRAEFAEIQAGIKEDMRQSEGVTWRELLLPSNRYRIIIAVTIQLAAQCTGNTSLAYYAPQIFSSVGAGRENMFMTGFFGIVKIVGVITFMFFFVENYGRRIPFMAGAFAMGTFMLVIAAIAATNPPGSSDEITSAGMASMAMIYAEAISFNMSWGPLPWLYISEIFPNRIREIGIATGAASQWLFNFAFSQITPHALDKIGWGTFLMFGLLNYVIIVYAFFFLKETRGYSLEQMELVFGDTPHQPNPNTKTLLSVEDEQEDEERPLTPSGSTIPTADDLE